MGLLCCFQEIGRI